MARFKDIKALQTFSAAHALIHYQLNHDSHLDRRDLSSKAAPPRSLNGVNSQYESLDNF